MRGRRHVRTARRGPSTLTTLLLGPAVFAVALTGIVPASARAEAPATASATAGDQRAQEFRRPRPTSAEVPVRERDRLLGSSWRTSSDRAWALSGDADGLHVLTGRAANGYRWTRVATLAEPGMETDRWIGNACALASGRRLVVVYAPRSFTNKEALFNRGGFTAVVDLVSGSVRKLPVTASLAYFNPGCGRGEHAILTQMADGYGRTRLLTVDGVKGSVAAGPVVKGQLTSAVPVGSGIVAADAGRLVSVDRRGRLSTVAVTRGVPFDVHPDAAGGLVFVDRRGAAGTVRRAVPGSSSRRPWRVTTLATGPVDRLGVDAASDGTVLLLGRPDKVNPTPRGVLRAPGAAVGAHASSTGALVVGDGVPAAGGTAPGEPQPVNVPAWSARTGRSTQFTLDPRRSTGAADAAGRAASPALRTVATRSRAPGPSRTAARVAAADAIVDADRTCSVPRNDPRNQAMQPKPRQVEWAVDQAVTQGVQVDRPADWKNLGMPAYSPAGYFPRTALSGGGRIPAQVLLGILAQESNLWQAARFALPGVTANPLIGNYYGLPLYDKDGSNDWDIDWSESDCGYGVGQITDGMRRDDTMYSSDQQRALALDFAANVARSQQMLAEKWNQVRDAGMTLNGGDASKIENWFYAVWAYNSGFHPKTIDGEPWGLGWANNPLNPVYPANRAPFLETSYADASHPQDWPYPEKVLGWAGHPLEALEGPDRTVSGFRPAWWNGADAMSAAQNRATVKPPADLFCDASNDCEAGASYTPNGPDAIGAPAGPCAHKDNLGRYDLRCWYHQSATWKSDCSYSCGNELLRFDPGYAYQADETTTYVPNCSLDGLPSNALVVDDVPTSAPAVRPGCSTRRSDGTFGLDFAEDGQGRPASKIDFHQIGGGFGAHFWFTHTRLASDAKLRIKGTWTLDRELHGWARVLVHMPDLGAHTQQAAYVVDLGDGRTKRRVVLQRTQQNRWVSLGAMPFDGTPKVSLSNVVENVPGGDGDGSEDVAWDAVAFQPLPAKPREVMVALGDSYSSGEGASQVDGSDYTRETDNHGTDVHRNSCHRSPYAWSRQGHLSDSSATIGSRADSWDPALDYLMAACSGAQTENVLPYYTVAAGQAKPANAFGQQGVGQFRELSQLDRGFVDEDTSLVTLSIGGNDSRFGDVVQQCIIGLSLCQDATLSGDTEPLTTSEPALIKGKVEDSIVVTLQEIRRRAPHAKIVLMGYPLLFERSGSCVAGIGTSEAPWLNEMGNVLGAHMGEAVDRAGGAAGGFWFSDPRDEFRPDGLDRDGHAVCGDPEKVHGIVTTQTKGDKPLLSFPWPGRDPGIGPSQQSFHPKKEGQLAYAQSLDETLGRMGR